MGSYTPRHLKHEPSIVGSVLGRRGLAIATGAAIAVPAVASMGSADAAPAGAGTQAAAATVPAAANAANAAAAAAVVQTKTFTNNVRVLHYGSTGSLVKTVQKRIGGLAVDGSFGPKTLAAVKRYQRSHRLAVDGYVGPHTWYSLGGFPGYGGGSGSGGGSSNPAPPSRSGGHSSSAVVNIAKRYLGIPYVYGGASPSGFDCSGFVQYVFGKAGISVPRTASAQQRAAHRVYNPRPGDLVFFGYPAYHVGIYVGGGKMASAHKPGTVTDIGGIYGAHTFGRIG